MQKEIRMMPVWHRTSSVSVTLYLVQIYVLFQLNKTSKNCAKHYPTFLEFGYLAHELFMIGHLISNH